MTFGLLPVLVDTNMVDGYKGNPMNLCVFKPQNSRNLAILTNQNYIYIKKRRKIRSLEVGSTCYGTHTPRG